MDILKSILTYFKKKISDPIEWILKILDTKKVIFARNYEKYRITFLANKSLILFNFPNVY
jgi:hypothetical protein